jgi:hypothetical protein
MIFPTGLARGAVAQELPEWSDRELVQRLENWGKAQRLHLPGWDGLRTMLGAKAGSAERSFRSPQHWIAAQPNPTLGVDPLDARVIESAVCILPLYQHALLKAWYVRRRSPGKCLALAAEAAGVKKSRFSGFDAAIECAHALLVEALEVPAVIRKVRARQIVREVLAADA